MRACNERKREGERGVPLLALEIVGFSLETKKVID
jgi:hypothetical protein